MKAIILAAGEGKRLRPFTEDRPKCLIPLERKSIFDHQVDTMRRCGIRDIIAVKGYKADKITRQDVRYYLNRNYATTNMVMTLWCAKAELEGEVIVSYGDIVYNQEVLQRIIDSQYEISVVVDVNWKKYWKRRFSDPLKDAEALRLDSHGRIEIIGQKAENISDVEAGYIGLIKFKGRGMQIVRESFLNAQKVASQDGSPWGVSRSFENVYMTDMLQGIVNESQDIYGIKINGGWLEIDSSDDYELAKELFVEGRVVPVN